jgi:hypothetical protein
VNDSGERWDRVPGELLRAGLIWIGGALAARGVIDATWIEPLVGALTTLVGIGWAIAKRRRS